MWNMAMRVKQGEDPDPRCRHFHKEQSQEINNMKGRNSGKQQLKTEFINAWLEFESWDQPYFEQLREQSKLSEDIQEKVWKSWTDKKP